MNNQIVEQKSKSVYWQVFVYGSTNTRQFFCNAIIFTNQGTVNAFLNDVFTLQPGDTLSLNCDQNEVDETVYKMSFATGGINKLAVAYKINSGISEQMQNRLMSISRPMNRGKVVKQYVLRRGRGDF